MAIQSNLITVDHSLEDILSLDKQKKLIRFSDELDSFKELSQAELNQLSERAQTSWRLAKEGYDERRKEMDEPDVAKWIERVRVGVHRGQARSRTKIENKQKGWAYKWQDPRDVWVKENQFGWQKVVGGPERTIANSTGVGPHVIVNGGSEELVLMKRPMAVQRAWEEAEVEKNNRRAGELRDKYREDVERAGYKTFDPDNEKDGLRKGKHSTVTLSEARSE